jgi:hypothetical protein
MREYIIFSFFGGFYTAMALGYLNLISWILRKFGRTEEIKKSGNKMKAIAGYCNMICGRLGILFVASGLFIMAADYFHGMTQTEETQPESHVVNCVRLGTCEAS